MHASVGGLPDPGSKPPPASEARSPARLLLTALQVAHSPKEESGFGTELAGVPRPDEDETRWWPSACVLSGWPNPLGVAKGPTWRSGKLRGDPQATKTEWAPRGRANLYPFLVPPGLLPMLKTLPRQFHTPGPRDWRQGRWLSPGSKPRGADESAHVGANRNGKHSVARKSLRDTHPERRK